MRKLSYNYIKLTIQKNFNRSVFKHFEVNSGRWSLLADCWNEKEQWIKWQVSSYTKEHINDLKQKINEIIKTYHPNFKTRWSNTKS